jgi:hypothetical protein
MPCLATAFFASGFAALLCQVVWQRMLGIFAGSDTISAALVVGAFLTGLGVGSILGARFADRLTPRGALYGFAIAESGVGLFALGSKLFLYDWLASGLAGVVDHPVAIFALSFAGLVLPTTLMGLSLPLLSRAVATTRAAIAARIGALYGWNTLGAGLGALVGGWVVVGALGFEGALWLAAGLQFFAALLVLGLARRTATTPTPIAVPRVVPAGPGGGLPLWCLLVFLSGYIIVALEIVWVRVLGQVGQFHAYLFPTVLGVFLLADGLGMSMAARALRRIDDPRPVFFITQAAGFILATTLLVLLWFFLPFWPLAELISVDGFRFFGGSLVTTIILTVLVVGPPSFLIGMTFPLVQHAVQRDLSSVGARVGWVQLANIAGNAAGSVGTGLVTLQVLGTSGTLRLLAGLSLAPLLGWLIHRGWRGRRMEVGLALACAVMIVAIPGNASIWARQHGSHGSPRDASAEDHTGLVYFRDDARFAPAGAAAAGPVFVLGFSQGRLPFLPVHQFLGAVGPLLHPDPRRLLVIGVGSGGTPWAAGIRPESEVRAIELVVPVLTTLEQVAARAPDGPIGRMFADPRWRMEYGDGRRALAAARTRYDVIEADAILPQSSHSGLLYSREFLELARQRLAPGGLVVQWAPSARVVDTFAAVFPHVLLLMPVAVLVGSNDPIPFTEAGLRARFADPGVLAHLRTGNPDPIDWPALFAGPNPIWTPRTPRQGVVLTDMFPRDEFYLNHPPIPADRHPRLATQEAR